MIKRLARCIREYKWAALLSPLCMVGEVSMEVLIPLVMADLYDYGVVQQNMQVVVSRSILLVLCAAASLCFGCASAVFASRRARVLQKICATICSTGCRNSALAISIIFESASAFPRDTA